MTFFVVLLIMTFLALLIQLVPGDPVRLVLGAKAPDNWSSQVRHDMYLDKPVPAQVYYFFTNAVHGRPRRRLPEPALGHLAHLARRCPTPPFSRSRAWPSPACSASRWVSTRRRIRAAGSTA